MLTIIPRRRDPVPSTLYPLIWRFAQARQAIYRRRLSGAAPPWTDDPILREHRFTNAYRAADRVSQGMIRILEDARDESPDTVLYRVLVFKLFNRIETWEAIVARTGPLVAAQTPVSAIREILDERQRRRKTIYSAAYVMPGAPGGGIKHHWHLDLVQKMLDARLGSVIADIGTRGNLGTTYRTLRSWPSLGPFLAFQLAIDLNYSVLTDHAEADFVVAGPGALDGLSKCFTSLGDHSPARAIDWMTERQEEGFAQAGVEFDDLWGRPLQLIDVQNLCCEVSKYSRKSHPDVKGRTGRTRIKQRFKPAGPLPGPFFPPKWGINDAVERWCAENRTEPTPSGDAAQPTDDENADTARLPLLEGC